MPFIDAVDEEWESQLGETLHIHTEDERSRARETLRGTSLEDKEDDHVRLGSVGEINAAMPVVVFTYLVEGERLVNHKTAGRHGETDASTEHMAVFRIWENGRRVNTQDSAMKELVKD